MAYINVKDYEYLRRRTREVIIRKGFYIYYYRLLKTDVISSPAYNDVYKESMYKHYARFKIKVLLNLQETRSSSINYSEFGLQIVRKLTAKMFVWTPAASFNERNTTLLLHSPTIDDSTFTMPLIPQLGDFIRFPIEEELPYQRNGMNDLHVTQFYEVTNLNRNSFINIYLYTLQTVQRVDKHSEKDLGDVTIFTTNALTFRHDSLYGERSVHTLDREVDYTMPDIYDNSVRF